MSHRVWTLATVPTLQPQIQLTAAQLSLILGLESVLQNAGLGLICPFCAGSAPCDGLLTTDNDPFDLSWKLDCDCRHRVGARAGVMPMQPSGDLILLAAELLKDARLDVRCLKTHAQCRYTPLTTQRLATQIRVECPCGRMTFKAATPAANPN
jgi:hypothetical protein